MLTLILYALVGAYLLLGLGLLLARRRDLHEGALVGFLLLALLGALGGLGAYALLHPVRVKEPEKKPIQIILLDLSEHVANACLLAFVRYMQGGHVSEYHCEVREGEVALIGPDWDSPEGLKGHPPVRELGRVPLVEGK